MATQKKAKRSRVEKKPAPMPKTAAAVSPVVSKEAKEERQGQLASEKARFEVRAEERVLEPNLGTLPPGYDLTFVRGWLRDPQHIVATWDINDPEAERQAKSIGWDRMTLRAIALNNRVMAQARVGRQAGTHHLDVPSGITIRLAVGLERTDGYFLTLARSAPLRVPPEGPASDEGVFETMRVPPQLDRRMVLRGETPAVPGNRTPGRMSAGWRLYQRIERAAQAFLPEELPPEMNGMARGAQAGRKAEAGADLEGAGVHAPTCASLASTPFLEERPRSEAEGITSPAGWMPPAGVEEVPTSPRHWLDRWASGPMPSSPGRWLAPETAVPGEKPSKEGKTS